MNEIKLTIDGKAVTARPDQTILEVIRENRIAEVPTLCHDPKLPPYGSCYLCVVEVEGVAKLIPSCSSPVADKMVVHTDNPRIRAARKTALELLLSNHYADCLAPCKQTCPAGVDVQGYIALIAMGKPREAVRLIKETNPLPLVCGRVCVRECEVACRRNRVDERVGIDYLKRFATDIDIEDPWMPEPAAANGRKVAIVGGGPAGLTCAYYLVLKGYGVTLFEKSAHLGGMLRYGIPEYRLPKELLDREIRCITDLGVTVKTGVELGKDLSVDNLQRQGFAAVYLAFGAQKAKGMRLAGEDEIAGVLGGVDFLRQLQGEKKPAISGRVVVVGGGNTAIDAARTSVRLGAAHVTLLYRRTRKEMPAHPMEIAAAIEEGVELVELSAPVELLHEDKRLSGMTCIRMELGEPDASGRRSPVPKAGSEYRLPCDFVISAIGQDVDLCGLQKDPLLKSTRHGTLVFDEGTFATSLPGVFTGGDMATGPAVAIDAIAHGKIAANAIDHFIRTGKTEAKPSEFISRKEAFGEIPDGEFAPFPKIGKEKMPELPAEARAKTFEEVELGFRPEQAACEAGRCLECGCSAYFDCDLRRYAVDFGIDISAFVGEVRKYPVDKAHPFITLDPNKCIACGRCVRTCTDVLRVSALGFVHRGFKSVVRPALEKKLLETSCISCGNCIAACPTGAIAENLPFTKPGPWAGQMHAALCHFCSVGCELNYKEYAPGAYAAVGNADAAHNRGYLCLQGRFGYRYMLDAGRLAKPLVMGRKGPEATGWKTALAKAAAGIQDVVKKHGPGAVAILASPRLASEELFRLRQWAHGAFQADAIGSASFMLNPNGGEALAGMLGMDASTATMDDLDRADLILAVNADLTADNLVAEVKILEAQRRGARLIAVASSATALGRASDLWLDARRGSATALIAGLANALLKGGKADPAYIDERTEGFAKFKSAIARMDAKRTLAASGIAREKFARAVAMLSGAANIVVVYGIDQTGDRSADDLSALAGLLLMTGKIGKPGNGLLLVRDFANSQGMVDLGIASASGALAGKLRKKKIKALIAFGEDPLATAEGKKLLAGVEFLVAADFFVTATTAMADVVLPLATPLEGGGTFTSCDRRVQRSEAFLQPLAGRNNLEIISELAAKFAVKLVPAPAAEVFRELTREIPAYRGVEPGHFWGGVLFADRFATPSGRASFLPVKTGATARPFEKLPLLSTSAYIRRSILDRLRP